MASSIGTQLLPKSVAQRKDLDIRSGDTVRVKMKIQEKDKTRIQLFEGIVLARKHGTETGGTFTVRKIASGVGVERIFPLYSPVIESIEIVRRANTRRSKLYFLRTKVARDIRRKLRNFVEFFASTATLIPAEEMVDETEVVEAEEVATEAQTTVEATTEETPAVE